MTKKDYIQIAEISRQCGDIDFPTTSEYSIGLDDCRKVFVFKFADLAIKDNPRFDREKFIKACGVRTS